MAARDGIQVHPLTPARWEDLERLFGPNATAAGCWCMWWRISRAEFSANGTRGNLRAMKAIVDGRQVPGLIAYVDGEPAGWVSIDRRERFESLERSHTRSRVDDRPVWSIVCFFIGKPYRRRGLHRVLIEAAVDHARRHGATMVEAYPGRWKDPATSFMGLESEFAKAGFRRVREAPKLVVRRAVRPRRSVT